MSRTSTVGRLELIATLGGPSTFAGQATTAFLTGASSAARVGYYPTMDDVWRALRSGEVDGIILTAESTHVGMTDVARTVLRDPELQVLGEVILPYHCTLLGKPDARLDEITCVTGHGSLAQCRRYLGQHLPRAEITVHDANSVAAARQVLEGDGSLAVVGTLAAAAETGLAILANDVDDGSSGCWWLIGRASEVPGQGGTIIVEATVGQATWPAFLRGSEPWLLRSILVEPSGQALFEYHTLTAWTLPETHGRAAVPPPQGRIRGRFDSVVLH